MRLVAGKAFGLVLKSLEQIEEARREEERLRQKEVESEKDTGVPKIEKKGKKYESERTFNPNLKNGWFANISGYALRGFKKRNSEVTR